MNLYQVILNKLKNTNIAYVKPHILKVKGNDHLILEECSERTKFGMVGAIETGHIPIGKCLGFKRDNKKLVPDPLTKIVIVKIFNLYLEGNSHQKLYIIF